MSASTSTRLRLGCGLVLAIVLGVHVATHLRVTTTITHFLPASADTQLALLSDSLTQAELARTMILAVHGSDAADTLAGAHALATALQKRPEVAWLRQGVAADLPQRVFALYFPRRYGFISSAPERELPSLLSDAGLRQAARALKAQLGTPMGSFVRRMAPADPLQLFQRQLSRIEASRGSELRPIGDQLVSADGTRAFMFLATRASPFDTRAQTPFLAFVQQAFARISAARGGKLQLELSGLQRFASASERVIKADIKRVSTISLLGIVVLFLVMFRSLRYLLLGLLPLGFGLLCATSFSLYLFSELHGMTLAFGSSLIGVCIDYPTYYFNHHMLEPDPGGPAAGLRRVWMGLFLGCVTTVMGLCGLAWSSFPGIREIAVFGATGVSCALLSMWAFVPPLLPARPRVVPLQRRLAALCELGFERVAARPRLQLLLLCVGLAVSAAGLSKVVWVDDLRSLSPVDPRLQVESESLRARVSAMDAGRFVIAIGSDTEHALAANDRTAEVLETARADGLLHSFQSLHTWLFAPQLQARNRAQLLATKDLAERVRAAYTAEGFAWDGFAPFVASLSEPDPGPLQLQTLLDSPLSDVLRHFVLHVGPKIGVLTFVRGVHDATTLQARLRAIPGVTYFDQTQFLTQIYAGYRQRVVQLIVFGLGAVLLLVWLRYRRIGPTLAAFLPAVVAALMTTATLALCGRKLSLLHAVALLLVLSMGVDYGIFLAERARSRAGLGPTLLSLAVACTTTMLSFGLLGLSEIPALRAVGETTALGIFLSLVLAPTALLVLGHVEGDPDAGAKTQLENPS